jgi:bifunctional DNase/RNase
MSDDFTPGDFEEPPSFFPKELGGQGTSGEPVQVQIDGVYSSEESGTIHRYVQLQDPDGRVLPIAIGPFEAMAIHIALEGATVSRPLTHDLLKILVERFDGDVDRVVIDDLWNATYYAKLYLRKGDEELEIDCRPSDAIAVALRCNAPIFVLEGILDSFNEGE